MQEIILLEDIDGLGRRGSVVRAKNGYAMNFILPKGKGVRATTDNLTRLQGLRVQFEADEKVRIERAKTLSEQFEGKSITITMKASEEGSLYGSVSVPMIVEALAADNMVVDAKAVKLIEPIKHVGVYDVPIQLHETVRVEFKVWVVEEKAASADVAAPADGGASTDEGAEAPAVETESA